MPRGKAQGPTKREPPTAAEAAAAHSRLGEALGEMAGKLVQMQDYATLAGVVKALDDAERHLVHALAQVHQAGEVVARMAENKRGGGAEPTLILHGMTTTEGVRPFYKGEDRR